MFIISNGQKDASFFSFIEAINMFFLPKQKLSSFLMSSSSSSSSAHYSKRGMGDQQGSN